MYIGINLGTSGVKVILLNEQGEVVASQTEKLTVSRPHPLWSEQDPEQWWQATDRAMKALGNQHSLQDVKALGIAWPDAWSNLTGCSTTGIAPCHFVERRALCARVHFAGSESSAITSDYRQPDDARIYCA